MLLKLSGHVPADVSSWIKNQLSVSKLILKGICVHGNFYKYLSSDIFTTLNIKIITENGIAKRSPRGFFDCLKRINSTSRWKFESGLTLSVQTQQSVSLEYLFLSGNESFIWKRLRLSYTSEEKKQPSWTSVSLRFSWKSLSEEYKKIPLTKSLLPNTFFPAQKHELCRPRRKEEDERMWGLNWFSCVLYPRSYCRPWAQWQGTLWDEKCLPRGNCQVNIFLLLFRNQCSETAVM